MNAYYNEWDAYPAQWLRNLIAAGHIPAGDVDERSIEEVQADDLKGYEQCHFFAGIAGWPLALALAGWDGPAWSGSCPCQPLSSAGQRKGHADQRHLWPAFHALIAERRPSTVFGEQVASKDGREWLAGVRADLEDLGYAVGAADLCAASVGAPHIRQRLWWVADTMRGRHHRTQEPAKTVSDQVRKDDGLFIGGGCLRRLGDADRPGPQPRRSTAATARQRCAAKPDGRDGGLGDAGGTGSGRDGRAVPGAQAPSEGEGCELGRLSDQPLAAGFWSDFEFIPCADGKARRVESGVAPLAVGVPNRVGQLRAYGNAITPQVAAEFVTAFMECRP